MVVMYIFKNKILIDNNRHYNCLHYVNKCIDLQCTYYGDRALTTYIRYDKNRYHYIHPFTETYILIYKSKYWKEQEHRLNIININYDIMYYLYLIYIKYYTIRNTKNYNIISITSRKLFNCRDYYKIYSYI